MDIYFGLMIQSTVLSLPSPSLISKMQMTACYLLNGNGVLHYQNQQVVSSICGPVHKPIPVEVSLSSIGKKMRCFNRTFDIYLDTFEIECISSLIPDFKASFNILLTELYVAFY